MILNLELWQQAVESVRPHKVSWHWVRGHDGHPQNEYVNHLATRAARELSNSDGLVPSEFDAWMELEKSKGRDHGAPSPFPEAESFRPTRPYQTI